MMPLVQMAEVLEAYVGRFERDGREQWKGVFEPGAEDARHLRELAARLREGRSRAATPFTSADASLLERHATQLRATNEPLLADAEVSPEWRRNAELSKGFAFQMAAFAEWIRDGIAGR